MSEQAIEPAGEAAPSESPAIGKSELDLLVEIRELLAELVQLARDFTDGR